MHRIADMIGRSAILKQIRILPVLLLLGHIPAPLVADPETSESIPVEIERISDRVLVARCPVGSNVTAIDTRQGIVIVDTHLSPHTQRRIMPRLVISLRHGLRSSALWQNCDAS